MFKRTLDTQHITRTENSRITSHNHELQTVRTNKIALSAYDDKRYIEPNGIDTLPFGYETIRDQATVRTLLDSPTVEEMLMSPDWNDVDINLTRPQPLNRTPSFNITADAEWHTPDPGLNRSIIRESDISSAEIVDFDLELETPSPPRNPFILYEALESDREETPPSPVIGRKRNQNVLELDRTPPNVNVIDLFSSADLNQCSSEARTTESRTPRCKQTKPMELNADSPTCSPIVGKKRRAVIIDSDSD